MADTLSDALKAVWTELDEQADRDLANDLSGSAAWCLGMRDKIDAAAQLAAEAEAEWAKRLREAEQRADCVRIPEEGVPEHKWLTLGVHAVVALREDCDRLKAAEAEWQQERARLEALVRSRVEGVRWFVERMSFKGLRYRPGELNDCTAEFDMWAGGYPSEEYGREACTNALARLKQFVSPAATEQAIAATKAEG